MENQTNIISNEMNSLHESVSILGNISSLFELGAAVLILLTIIYIKKNINLAGSNMMLIGVVMSSLLMFAPLFIYTDGVIKPELTKYVLITEFLANGFLFYAALGFIRFSKAVYAK